MRQSVLTSELGKSEFICRDIIKHWLTSVVFRSEDIDTVISDAHGQDLELLIDKLSGEIGNIFDLKKNKKNKLDVLSSGNLKIFSKQNLT